MPAPQTQHKVTLYLLYTSAAMLAEFSRRASLGIYHTRFAPTRQQPCPASAPPAALHRPVTGSERPRQVRWLHTARVLPFRRPIVGGNWKCNPVEHAKLPDLVKNFSGCDAAILDKCDVYVCPSPLHVAMCKFTNGAKIAPQNMNFTGCGAYTGEMAADQMVDMGIEWVLM